LLTNLFVFSAALWVVVAAVAVANGGRITREQGGSVQKPRRQGLIHLH
jgi:hypothetical protein